MPDLYQLMKNGYLEDTPESCRERRRRRILLRAQHTATTAAAIPHVNADSRGKAIKPENELQEPMRSQLTRGLPVDVPDFGTMSVAGRSRDMEDAIAVKTSLCAPTFNGKKPVHFFAVYDGHAGAQVAALCREKMHVVLEGELTKWDHTGNHQSGAGGSSSSGKQAAEGEEEWKEKWKAVLKRTFLKLDQEALSTCGCGSIGWRCGCPSKNLVVGGSTAVVAVVTDEHIIVANCGDSRAVLCRGGKPIALSVDQKPDRPDEHERILAAGGRVVYLDVPRVEGILAMSRAMGDRYLKPIVISEPEICFIKREPDDECLILASDGLWDVVNNDLACLLASECLLQENTSDFINPGPLVEDDVGGPLFSSQSVLAAALLTRLALARKSYDNISVIVVDLMRGG
ncbi:probable protein phosphatase 2C 75 [Euphorbia lathyris]|uniref:probable protein phosphatase 2C 75 n=1 Tax=Euphorbia lathyris TaxID=212925 RepID=UPI0033136410